MHNITIEPRNVNPEALDGELRAALGEVYAGLSTGPYGICIHLADEASPAQEQQAKQIVASHDPARLTAGQQAELDRVEKLEQARNDYGVVELDAAAYKSQPALIQQLAQKIVMLEREIADLRANR